MFEELAGFGWDDANVDHILRHNVTAFEVEEAFSQRNVVLVAATVKREKRWKLPGRTLAGRYLVVVFTVRRRLLRTVTAYDMNADERRIHAPKID